ncbi:MAG: hypothetical protein AB8I69_10635 [Anaerolineae bacterium]
MKKAVKKRAPVQLKTRCISMTILHAAFERPYIEPTGKLSIEPDCLIVSSQAIAQSATDTPQSIRKTAAGFSFGQIGPEDSTQNGTWVRAITKDYEIGQQITRLLSGQLQELIIALDSQPTKGVQSQHLGSPLFRWSGLYHPD